MVVTDRDAASMYARACRAWYGRRAPRVVKDTIRQLRAKNDAAGVRMWSLVAEELPAVKAQSDMAPSPASTLCPPADPAPRIGSRTSNGIKPNVRITSNGIRVDSYES